MNILTISIEVETPIILVKVRAHRRVRNGKVEKVRSYYRKYYMI